MLLRHSIISSATSLKGPNPAKTNFVFGCLCNISGIASNIRCIPLVHKYLPTKSTTLSSSLLIKSIFDPKPVIFLEHRWLHEIKDNDFVSSLPNNLSFSNVIRKGKDITIVSMSYLTLEAIKAAKILKVNNIDCEIIDLVSLKPLNYKSIFKSVKKTKKLLVLDTGFPYGSIASEITSVVARKMFKNLSVAPQIMTMPDIPEPTSFQLTKNLYITDQKIVIEVSKILKKKVTNKMKVKKNLHDIPGEWFKGPF